MQMAIVSSVSVYEFTMDLVCSNAVSSKKLTALSIHSPSETVRVRIGDYELHFCSKITLPVYKKHGKSMTAHWTPSILQLRMLRREYTVAGEMLAREVT
jgi:hypothetical protein